MVLRPSRMKMSRGAYSTIALAERNNPELVSAKKAACSALCSWCALLSCHAKETPLQHNRGWAERHDPAVASTYCLFRAPCRWVAPRRLGRQEECLARRPRKMTGAFANPEQVFGNRDYHATAVALLILYCLGLVYLIDVEMQRGMYAVM